MQEYMKLIDYLSVREKERHGLTTRASSAKNCFQVFSPLSIRIVLLCTYVGLSAHMHCVR